MNLLDIVVLIILGFCIIRGFFRGIIKEVSSILGVVAGFFAAHLFYAEAAVLLQPWVSTAAYRHLIAFLLIFFLVYLAISLTGIIIKYLLKKVFLAWVDRLAGVGFGALKGVLIVSVLGLGLTAFLPQGNALLRDSLVMPPVSLVAEQMAQVVSARMQAPFFEKLKDLKKTWWTKK